MKKYVKIKMFVELSKKDNILVKSHKMSYIIYADLKSLIKKINGRANNPERSSTKKIGKYIPCRYSMSTIWAFEYIQKHSLYRGKDFMKKLCESLREHAKKIIDFEKVKNVTFNKKKN